ncbi:MAG: hypothetical protein ACQCN3_01300 [Candidatus Bathyarchaeia archaeon]
MPRTNSLVLLLILILMPCVMAEFVSAQSTTKPSPPEFTVTLISSPDTQVLNKTIELSIKNQPSIPDNGSFYNVRIRVNNGNWSVLYPDNEVPIQSNSEYTILSYPSEQPDVEHQYHLTYTMQTLFPGDKIDFQVQTMVGGIYRGFNPNATNQFDMYPYVFIGEKSDWSNTQTLIMPTTVASPSPSIPEFPLVALVFLLIAGSLTTTVILLRKK